MKRIYKWTLEITDSQVLALPEGAKILTVQMQGRALRLWALIDPTVAKVRQRTFEVFGTGHDMDEWPRDYIGTVQQPVGVDLVWHVFERHP